MPDADSAPRRQDGAHVPRHLGLALVVIAAAQLMIVLDATIVNVALPQMQRALGFSGSGLEWIVTAYSLAFGSLLLLGGRLGDLYGRRRIFMTGVRRLLDRLAARRLRHGEAFLLSARALQGAGAALAAPTALALIATTFPPGTPRNRALGVYAGMSGAGGAIGLLLGGILTTYVSWRWVFFVNVPIGALLIALAAYALAHDRPPARPARHPRRRHEHGRPGAARLRAHGGRGRSGRRLALGRRQRRRRPRRLRRPARGLRLHRDAQHARGAAAAPAEVPPPLRRLHHDAVARHGDVRGVLLPDHLHADGVGLQPGQGRPRLGAVPADDHRHQHAGGARAPDARRRAAAAARRAAAGRHRLHVAVAAERGRQRTGRTSCRRCSS